MMSNEILGQHPMYAEGYFVDDQPLQAFFNYGLDWEVIPCNKRPHPFSGVRPLKLCSFSKSSGNEVISDLFEVLQNYSLSL